MEGDVMTGFKETKLIDVLNWIPSIKRIKPVDIEKYTVSNALKYPFYGQQLTNNGIVDYIAVENRFLNNKDSSVYLLIASNNHSINIVTTPFYIKEDHAATSTIGHPRMSRLSALYIKGSIQRVFDTSFDYNAKALQGVLQNTCVTLPFISEDSDELDWNYMEQYIKRIEEQYIKRIEGYLVMLGYSSVDETTLNSNDKLILEKNFSTDFKIFKLQELFDVIKRGKRIKSLDRIKGTLPFITAGVEKMGFSEFIGNSKAEIFPANSLTIDMFGNTFYRGYSYGADDHVAVLYHSKQIYSKKVLQYIQPQIIKSILGKFSYSRNFYATDAYEVEIRLPVTSCGEIDIEHMENYIKVIEKKVVQKLRYKMDKNLETMN
jgi:hypothetical protein